MYRWILLILVLIVNIPPVVAQDVGEADPSKQADGEAAEESDQTEAEEPDPFAVPEGASADELIHFIRNVKRTFGRSRNTVKQAAGAAVEAAAAIRQLDGLDLEQEKLAIAEQLQALQLLSRSDARRKEQMAVLVNELIRDQREEISRIGTVEAFKAEVANAFQANPEVRAETIVKYKDVFGTGAFDRESYGVGISLARAIEDPENPEMAARLYEYIAEKLEESDDVMLRSRAKNTRGASRRARLPGNFMKLSGNVADGSEFDWDSYRGKTVLVDFWASWCGPCRAEIPNMKRNLESFRDRGFAIVGVNLDRTLEECNDYVEQESLTWQNIVAEEGTDNPIVTYYGISAIPTAILVDTDGKVVSLRARGAELDRLLAEIMGEPEKDQPKEASKDEGSDDT